jgi:membrane associated rhomboid family serine protease
VNSKDSRPVITYMIIIACVIIMIHLSTLPQDVSNVLYNEYALRPSYLTHGMRIISVVTYMFLHAGWVHLLINSFALWGVGTVIEKSVGSVKFGIVFLASGIVAGLGHVLVSPDSSAPLVGASGSVFGVLALVFLLEPFKLTPLFVVPLPAFLVGLLLISVEVAALIWSQSPLIAHDAHLAGFAAGAVGALWIDNRKALKGLVIVASVVILLYLTAIFFNVI